ncbi:MAG TPA: hypothetical protein VKS24_00590 [Bradyrhizobium sp.]|nr:hypothetical protein [Bradyrhizobium sp.]
MARATQAIICRVGADHIENVGKYPLEQGGKHCVNENDEEDFAENVDCVPRRREWSVMAGLVRLVPAIHFFSHADVLRRGCPEQVRA